MGTTAPTAKVGPDQHPTAQHKPPNKSAPPRDDHTGELANGEPDSNHPTPEQTRTVLLQEGTRDPLELKTPIAKMIMACTKHAVATQQQGTNQSQK